MIAIHGKRRRIGASVVARRCLAIENLEYTVPLRIPESSARAVIAYLDARRAQRPLAPDIARAVTFRRAVRASPLRVRRFDVHVPAGFPSPADDYVEDQIDLNAHLIQ